MYLTKNEIILLNFVLVIGSSYVQFISQHNIFKKNFFWKKNHLIISQTKLFHPQVEFERVRAKDTAESDSPSKTVKRVLFGRMNPYPQKKVMTFNKHTKDFGFSVKYGELDFLSEAEQKWVNNLLKQSFILVYEIFARVIQKVPCDVLIL